MPTVIPWPCKGSTHAAAQSCTGRNDVKQMQGKAGQGSLWQGK